MEPQRTQQEQSPKQRRAEFIEPVQTIEQPKQPAPTPEPTT